MASDCARDFGAIQSFLGWASPPEQIVRRREQLFLGKETSEVAQSSRLRGRSGSTDRDDIEWMEGDVVPRNTSSLRCSPVGRYRDVEPLVAFMASRKGKPPEGRGTDVGQNREFAAPRTECGGSGRQIVDVSARCPHTPEWRFQIPSAKAGRTCAKLARPVNRECCTRKLRWQVSP